MPDSINVTLITDLHKKAIIHWKTSGENPLTEERQHKDFYRLVEENHAFNYQLWHAEDRARRDDLG
jgi:hypothetical protein